MPVTIFDCQGISATRRDRIQAAVEAGGKHFSASYEAWISSDPFRGSVRVLIKGPNGFDRTVGFALDEDPTVIKERVRQTLEE
jgi:hypothetical protein